MGKLMTACRHIGTDTMPPASRLGFSSPASSLKAQRPRLVHGYAAHLGHLFQRHRPSARGRHVKGHVDPEIGLEPPLGQPSGCMRVSMGSRRGLGAVPLPS